MFIDASTKEFTHVNNASPSYDVAFEHILYNIYILQVSASHIVKLKFTQTCAFSSENVEVLIKRIHR